MLMTLRVCSRAMHSWVKVLQDSLPNWSSKSSDFQLRSWHENSSRLSHRQERGLVSQLQIFHVKCVSSFRWREDERWLAQGRQNEARHAKQERHRRRIWRRKIYVSWTERERSNGERKVGVKEISFWFMSFFASVVWELNWSNSKSHFISWKFECWIFFPQFMKMIMRNKWKMRKCPKEKYGGMQLKFALAELWDIITFYL